MKYLMVMFVLVFQFSGSAMAEGTFEIENFEVWSNTTADLDQIRITGATMNNPDGCTDTDSYMVDTTLSEEVRGRIYSTLLAAVMASRKVRVTVDGCIINRPKIVIVRIK
ncbi:MAG: hypothetical protein COC04_01305 [Gammaproteobacteria bacterium]|nr:MAG: hypothetical protein COC04_01305 [Gammaproteobacteria bacterium]